MIVKERGAFMKHMFKYWTLSAILLCLFGGCNRIVDWGESNFNQGKEVENKAKSVRKYVKSVTVYDEFTTEGMFDVLWLSDEVRTTYADLHALRRCRNEEYKKTFLRRQLEENNHFITFYVLSPFEFQLADSQSKWSMCLFVDGDYYYPIETSVVELDQEYKAIFGKKMSRFKESYLVKFEAKTLEEKPIIADDVEKLELQFRSLVKETKLVWNFEQLTDQKLAQNGTDKQSEKDEQRTCKECA